MWYFNVVKQIEEIEKSLDSVDDCLGANCNSLRMIPIKYQNKLTDVQNRLNKTFNKMQLTNRENLGTYGEIMLLSEKVSDGYLDDRITQSTNDPKLEYIKKTLNILTIKLEDSFKNINKTLDSFQSGDYTSRIDESIFRGGAIQDVLKGINFLGEELANAAKLNTEGASQLSNTKEILEKTTNTLATASSEQAASLEEASASIEEITSNIRSTTEKSTQMQLLGTESKDSLRIGSSLATQTSSTMAEIDKATIDIVEAITVIDQIAFQTNILSLNAAVEAATAGEAGKGFSVVAGEVRNLAARSAEAASEIKAIVEQARTKAKNGNEISSKMLGGYEELESKIEQTVTLVEDVANASKEQMQGMDQINSSVAQLDHMTQENSSIALKVNGISQKVAALSDNMMELSLGKKFS